MNNLPVIEMFCSIQGEGKYAGTPSIFVRVSGCNLRCAFKNSLCDTPYSSFNPEKSPYKTLDDVVAAYNKLKAENPMVKHLVITGGEPLLYKSALEQFLIQIFTPDTIVTIETNGTMPPLNPLPRATAERKGKGFVVDLYSISPKLSSSACPWAVQCGKMTQAQQDRHKELIKDRSNLYKIIIESSDYQLKFVYSGPECEQEIKDIVSDLCSKADMSDPVNYMYWNRKNPANKIMLMPEGTNEDELTKNREEAVKLCIKNGWTYTDRLHITIWGQKRGV